MVWVVSTWVTLIFPYTAALTSSASGSGALTSVSGSGAGSAVTQGMEQLASIQGYSCLQFLITCHMQRWKGQSLGDLVTCVMSDRQRVDVMGNGAQYMQLINFALIGYWVASYIDTVFQFKFWTTYWVIACEINTDLCGFGQNLVLTYIVSIEIFMAKNHLLIMHWHVYFINFMFTKFIPIKMHPYQVCKCRVD